MRTKYNMRLLFSQIVSDTNVDESRRIAANRAADGFGESSSSQSPSLESSSLGGRRIAAAIVAVIAAGLGGAKTGGGGGGGGKPPGGMGMSETVRCGFGGGGGAVLSLPLLPSCGF